MAPKLTHAIVDESEYVRGDLRQNAMLVDAGVGILVFEFNLRNHGC